MASAQHTQDLQRAPLRLRWLTGAPGPRLAGRRLLLAIPVLLGVTLLTFFVLDVLPGNAAQQLLGAEASPEQVAQLRARLHLDRSGVRRYFEWLTGALRGDLGSSLASDQPVTTLVRERLPVSIEIVVLAFVLSLGIAVPAALLAAHQRDRLADRCTMILSMLGVSVANYVLALVLVLLFAVRWHLFPSIGFVSPSEGWWRNVRSLALPALALAVPLIGVYTRFLRGDLVEQLTSEEYVVTAIAKGIGPWRVLLNHALRNSLFGLLTVVGLNFGALVGGTVIIEQIFALPGIGQLLLQSINIRDVPVVQAIVLLLAVFTVLANLGVDLLYAELDPRVRLAHH